MKHIIGYFRLSNTQHNNGDGGDSDISISRQLSTFHEFVSQHSEYAHDCGTDDLVEPKGHRSGTSEVGRPFFRRLLEIIETGHTASGDLVGAIWTYDLARFTRGDDLMLLLKRMRRKKIEFITYRDAINLDSFDGEINVRTKGFINTLYAMNVAASQRARIKRERQAGAWIGRAPMGLVIEGKGESRHLAASQETYVTDGKKRTYLATVVEWMKLHTMAVPIGTPEGATILNQRGYRWRDVHGKPRPVYPNLLQDLKPEHYRGFIDDSLIDHYIARRKARAKSALNGPPTKHPPLLLHHVLFCADCGKRYGVYNHGGHTAYRHVYSDCTFGKMVKSEILVSCPNGNERKCEIIN